MTAVSQRMALGGVLVAVLVATLAAQGTPPAAQARREGWRPWYYSYDARGLTAAERSAVTARASAYERLFVVRDSLIHPKGYEATSHFSGGLGPAGRLGQWAYNIIFFDGIGHEGDAPLWASENPMARGVWIGDSGPADFKDAQGEIYRERPRSGPLAGMPATAVVYGGLIFESSDQARQNVIQVLLTPDGQLPWSDVSRERLLNVFIAEADAAVKLDQQALAQTTDAMERAQWSQALASATARLAQRRSELAAMSPAERASAAWVDAGSGGTFKLTAPGTPGSSHLIADKPDYYRVTGSRLEVRSLLVGFRLTDAKPGDALRRDLFDRAVSDSYRAFDWAAASRVLGAVAK